MRAFLLGLAAATAALLCAPGAAQADRERALEIYEQGKERYNAGEFAAAAELFERAWQLDQAPAYLFNIAQAYRLEGDCGLALAYYLRFLETGPGEKAAATVEEYARELREECEPTTLDIDSPPAGVAAVEPAAEVSPPAAPAPPADRMRRPGSSEAARVVLAAEGGAAFFDIGDVVLPVSATLRLGAAYPLSVGPVTLEPGAAVLLSTMPYRRDGGDSTALLTTVLVNAAASHPLGESMLVGGEIGIGLLQFSSLAAGNPFTEGAMESGGLRTLALRIGAGAEYRVGERLGVSAGGAFGYAGAHERLRDAISAVTRLELLTGVRYRW